MSGKALDLQRSMICESRVSGTSPVHERLVCVEHGDRSLFSPDLSYIVDCLCVSNEK